MDIDLQSLERYNRLARVGAERAATSLSELLGVETVVDVTRVSLVSPESARRSLIETVGSTSRSRTSGPHRTDDSGTDGTNGTDGVSGGDGVSGEDGASRSVADDRRDGGRSETSGDTGEPTCVGITLEGGISGRALLGLDESSRDRLVYEFLPSVVGSSDPAHAAGGVVEVGNIVLRGFVDGWADHLGTSVDTTPPRQVDPRSLDGESASSGIEEFVFLFESELRAVDADVRFDVCMLPDYATLTTLVGGATGLTGPTVSLRRLRQFRAVVERGTDRASDDIAAMTGFETDVDVDRFSFLPITETPNHVAPGRRVGTVFHFDGPPSGYAVLLLSEQSAARVADELLSGSASVAGDSPAGRSSESRRRGPDSTDETGLTALERSAVGEFGTVVTSGFVDGWADVFESEIDLSPPQVVEDDGRSILSPIAGRLARRQSYAFVLDIGVEPDRVRWGGDVREPADEIDFRLSIFPEETKLSHDSREQSRRVRNADVNQRRGRRNSGSSRWRGYTPRRDEPRRPQEHRSGVETGHGVAGDDSDVDGGSADRNDEPDDRNDEPADGSTEPDDRHDEPDDAGSVPDGTSRSRGQIGDTDGDRQQVGLGECAVTTDGEILATSGIGSSLALCLYDSAGTAGFAHVMLPRSRDRDDATDATFVDTGIEALVRRLEKTGLAREDLDAKLVGGSRMLEFSADAGDIGARNVRVARQEFGEHGIPVVSTHVGGDYGRSVVFDGETGEVLVRTADGTDSRL
ncbi:chemotaxis protein CheC [Salinirubrum litoreum]|uniref:Probable chemoreceptor glutamine deamidase CheD n=1 Tax=Salinirubrum litoreum TaxID=1126234 RepID=A0ABD5R9V3_9EURY|nr:chemotaxis protein CheC [Salinirubrum litoreum]